MSFECGNCGKNSVEQLGKWCSECQEKAMYDMIESDEIWYSQARLCLKCANAEGPDSSDYCSHYEMPLYMVKRKKKCKYYERPEYYGDDY